MAPNFMLLPVFETALPRTVEVESLISGLAMAFYGLRLTASQSLNLWTKNAEIYSRYNYGGSDANYCTNVGLAWREIFETKYVIDPTDVLYLLDLVTG